MKRTGRSLNPRFFDVCGLHRLVNITVSPHYYRYRRNRFEFFQLPLGRTACPAPPTAKFTRKFKISFPKSMFYNLAPPYL